jgi:DNA-binding CsgD family transcriptional regulator
MERPFADLLDTLDRAGSPDEAWRAGLEWLITVGVLWCYYAYTSNGQQPDAGRLIRYSSLPQAWLDHYDAQAFFRTDPAVRHCVRATTPILTGTRPPEHGSPAAWQLWEDARSGGFGGGIAIPLRLPGSALGGFSLVTDMANAEFLAWHTAHGRWAALAAHVVDQRILTLAAPPAVAPRLSPRERECLTWLAIGLRHDRIAGKLGITRPTVELHLANARRRLGARTREQTLAKAVALGLLDL